MNDFETFLSRHGEIVMQAILENWERFTGNRQNSAFSLEERWNRLMGNPSLATDAPYGANAELELAQSLSAQPRQAEPLQV